VHAVKISSTTANTCGWMAFTSPELSSAANAVRMGEWTTSVPASLYNG
jgi:hypothetical protein